MNHLHVYPTSRGARERLKTLTPLDSFHNTVTTIAEFESKSYYIPDKIFIDSNLRVLFFKENVDASLFVKSETIFKFFEELALEKVELEELFSVDSYAEYEKQIEELISIKERYKEFLTSKGFIDRTFIPMEYELSHGYIKNFSSITIYLDGYITKFEYELFEKISQIVPLAIEIEIDRFSLKNIQTFEQYDLESGFSYKINLSEKRVESKQELSYHYVSSLYQCSFRIEQVFFVFDAINKLIDSGIETENIVVILPDESFKYMLKKFDRYNYLNFAMGFDIENSKNYKLLEALYKSISGGEAIDKKRFELYEIDFSFVKGKITVNVFLESMAKLLDEDFKNEIEELTFKFSKIYCAMRLEFKEYLYLFLKELKNIRVDDVRGGKVTVIGPLESRGVSFDGVVIVDFNESFVPKINQKDIYLNSKIKSLLKLPTKKDRESLQKHLYFNLIAKSKHSFVCYCNEEPKSKFLYELDFDEAIEFLPSKENYFQINKVVYDKVEEVEFDAKKMIWSSTMFKTYLECPRRFYFRYIRSIKEKKEDKINEGTLLHKLLSECELFSQEEIYNKIEQYAPNIYYQKLWKQKLLSLVEFFQNHSAKVVAKEIKKQKNIEGIEFQGVADRIDLLPDGRHLLIDYKSGKIQNKSKNLDRLSDFQMPIYSLLFSEYKPDLAYLSLFNPKLESVVNFEEKVEIFYQNLAKLTEKKSLTAQKCEQLSMCRYCPYTAFCQRGEYS